MSGIRRGLYHIPPPDFAQELLAAKMASISPMPGSIIVNILLAPVLVIVAFFYSLAWDNTVAKFAKSRAAWKSNI